MSVKIPCNRCGKLFVAQDLRRWYCNDCRSEEQRKKTYESLKRHRMKKNAETKI